MKGEEKGRELEPTNYYHYSCFTLRAMGSQQAKYEQTPQSCLELWTVGCDWKGRGDRTTITDLETSHHPKDFNFCHSKNCTRDNLLHKISLFKVLKINRFLVAQICEVTCFLSFSVSQLVLQGQGSVNHVHVSSNSAKRWWEASWFPSQFSSVMLTITQLDCFSTLSMITRLSWLGLLFSWRLIWTWTHVSSSSGRDVNH